MTARATAVVLAALLSLTAAQKTGSAQQAPPSPTFDHDVRPILDEVCSRCHNEKKANAGLNLGVFMDPATIATKRDIALVAASAVALASRSAFADSRRAVMSV